LLENADIFADSVVLAVRTPRVTLRANNTAEDLADYVWRWFVRTPRGDPGRFPASTLHAATYPASCIGSSRSVLDDTEVELIIRVGYDHASHLAMFMG
jgi:hypothetical protein